MISIIVPIYNAEQYLHRCIDSILAQSYTDFELLLIDDGSPDNCGAICEEYAAKDCRVRVFHKENGGVSSARNLGLDNARGEYITFCDADDYVCKDWLNDYCDAINKSVDLAIQRFYIVNLQGDVYEKGTSQIKCGNTIEDKREMIVALMNQCALGFLWVKLFRREQIELHNIRFDKLSTFREDDQFLLEYLTYVNSFQCIDKTNYYYIHPPEGKYYGGDGCYTLLQIYRSLDVIFDRNIPYDICKIDYKYIKNGASQYINEGKELDAYHIDLYRRMVCVLNYTYGLKNRFRNCLIIHSPKFNRLARWIIRTIHSV